MRGLFVSLLVLLSLAAWGEEGNLARDAKAAASESQDKLTPELAIDGRGDTRWSGIPGHNSGVWYELRWAQPVDLAELVVRQYDRFTMEWDIQTWDEAGQKWVDAGHYGKAGSRLSALMVCPIEPPRKTTGVRIANITNGPSFTEVEAYGPEHKHGPALALASDLRGNFVGMLCDTLGASPISGKTVTLTGTATAGPWKQTATTDEHGLFFAQIPVGVKGQVVASYAALNQAFDATGFQRAVTPISSTEAPMVLKDGWKFAVDPPAGFEKPGFNDLGWAAIKVPAHWEMEGFRSRAGIGGYRVHFIGAPTQGRTMLRFDGVYSGAKVWVNGTPVAYHEGGFTPFEADITDLVKLGDNVIALQVTEHTNVSDNLDKMSLYADFPLAGIIRKVTLFSVPDVHIEGYDQACTFGTDGTATIKGRAAILNRLAKSVPQGTMRVSLLAPDGTVAAKTQTIFGPINALAQGEQPFSLTVPKPRKWDAEHPNLYTLRFELVGKDATLQTLDQTVGLRETKIQGSQLLINGTPVKFRGTCHHDSHPLMGRAVTPELTKQDLTLIKDANLNSVRTSHYPPIPELVEQADHMGLYVEDEADFCWVGVADDLRNTPRILQLTAELLARDRNHPSVFMWSLCNESSFGYGFERSHEWVRAADPSRPNGAATSAWLEIATLHNPISINRIKENEGLDKPMFFDEAWCIYQGIFGDVAEMWVDPGMRDYYAEPLPGIYDEFMKSKVTQGSMIWAWSDDLFCVPGRGLEYGRDTTRSHFVEGSYLIPGRGIVGDAPWGVVDGWRRPKPEFWITKKLQSPIHMDEAALDLSKPVKLPVRNEFDFTNLSELKVTYSMGTKTGTLKLNVPPHQSGSIEVPTGDGDLVIAFFAPDGRLVDKFGFAGHHPPPVKPTLPAGSLDLDEQSILAGESTHVIGKAFEMAFDRGGGYLRQCVAEGWPTLLELPRIHVLPTATPTQSLPNRDAWHLESMLVQKVGGSVDVMLEGSYPDFSGQYDLHIEPNGRMTVHSKFTYSGSPILAREVGMAFSVPRDCDTLTWDRKGEWNVYPADHIGRPKGTSRAIATHPEAVPPHWAWSQDNSPMGTNDFRSTKRHLRSASICYPNGVGVFVDSDGAHSLRANVETDRISVFVNDWYGGTNVGWGEWITNYGRGKELKTGDVIESELHLQLKGK